MAVDPVATQDTGVTTPAERNQPTGTSPGAKADENPIPPGVRYRDEIYKAAQAHGVDPLLLAAQAAQESGGPTSNSGSNRVQQGGGGHGVFQIDSGTYKKWLDKHHDGADVQENADKAAEIDAQNLKRTHGNVDDAMHLYNAGHLGGPTTQTKFPDGRILDYPQAVQQHRKMLEDAPKSKSSK